MCDSIDQRTKGAAIGVGSAACEVVCWRANHRCTAEIVFARVERPLGSARNCDNNEMARGWESKSVEAQQAEAGEKPASSRARLSPEEAAKQRQREVLHLSRRRIVQQLTTVQNPQHRKMLQDALAELDHKLTH